jgi:ADP-ribosylglycohydrolase
MRGDSIESVSVLALSRYRGALLGLATGDAVGNGSIMRLAPLPLFYADAPAEAIAPAAESSRTTHGACEAVDACRYLAGLLAGAVRGVPKETLLSSRYAPRPRRLRARATGAGHRRHRRRFVQAEGSPHRSRAPDTSSNRSRPRCGRSTGPRPSRKVAWRP